jgi:hypothetical protein
MAETRCGVAFAKEIHRREKTRPASQPIDLIFGPAVFDRDVLALDQVALFQALAIGAQAFAEPVRRCASA